MQYLLFCDWPISFSVMSSRFIHVVAGVSKPPFLRLNNVPLYKHFVYGHLGCFHVLVVVNNSVMNMGMKVFLWRSVFSSFGCINRSGIAESCVFHGECTILHFHRQCTNIPVSPHQHLIFSVLGFWGLCLHSSHSLGGRWYLIVVWISISLMINNGENLSVFSYACWPFVNYLWRNVYLNLSPIFKSGYLIFSVVVL